MWAQHRRCGRRLRRRAASRPCTASMKSPISGMAPRWIKHARISGVVVIEHTGGTAQN